MVARLRAAIEAARRAKACERDNRKNAKDTVDAVVAYDEAVDTLAEVLAYAVDHLPYAAVERVARCVLRELEKGGT